MRVPERGDKSSFRGLIGSLDEITSVIHTNKKSKGEEVLQKDPLIPAFFDFLCVFPSCVAVCPSDVLKENINLYKIRFHAVIEA